jgi:hypothetical protein
LILKHYRELDIDNDVYDLWLNADKVTGFLQAKKALATVDIEDLLSIEEVSRYCEDQHCEEEDEYCEMQAVAAATPQNINIKVDIPQNFTVVILFVLNTVALGVNAWVTFTSLSK